MKKSNQIKASEKEIKVLKALFEERDSVVAKDAEELSSNTGLSIRSVKGVIGSLMKKGFAGREDVNGAEATFITRKGCALFEDEKEESDLSNKAVIFLAWKDGVEDVSALLERVNSAVKENTIKVWMNRWKRGVALPSIAK